ncbi:MAG: hypothetical protein GVY02_02150, partial [Bacteroidetes bacterium]|nr:hypothetical protein [Bacteroidota bacterium]
MQSTIRSVFLCVLLIVTGAATASAQVEAELERISITERSDENGYVIRFHLDQMVQGYEVRQPSANQIQIELLFQQVDTSGIELPDTNAEITDLKIELIGAGIGVAIRTAEGTYFAAEAYPDQNMRDLLLTLEYTDEESVREIIQNSEPFVWSVSESTPAEMPGDQPDNVEQSQPDVDAPETVDESSGPFFRKTEGGWGLRFGATGGISSADVRGASYSSDPRRDVLFGVTAILNSPYLLPYDIEAGLRSGIWMTKKGFEQPSETFNAKTIALDYIEFPVMITLAYPLKRYIKPVLSFGWNTSFKAGAEAIDFNGGRRDLDESIRVVNGGLIGGIGADLSF